MISGEFVNLAWNLKKALSNVDGYVEDLEELLKIWLLQTPELLSNLRLAMSVGDVAKIEFVAHTINGSLLILDAGDAISSASKLEHAARVGELRQIAQLVSQLEADLKLLTQQVEDYLNRDRE